MLSALYIFFSGKRNFGGGKSAVYCRKHCVRGETVTLPRPKYRARLREYSAVQFRRDGYQILRGRPCTCVPRKGAAAARRIFDSQARQPSRVGVLVSR